MIDRISDYVYREDRTPWEQNREHINAEVKAAIANMLIADHAVILRVSEADHLADIIATAIEHGHIPNVRIEY